CPCLLGVPMYIFTENGTLDVCGEEEVSVTPGALKYNIEFESDGNCTVMPNGFPSLRTKKRGLEYSVTFRFPKFNNYVKYDPVLELVDAEAEAEANSSANATAATPETVTPPTTDGPTPTIPTKPEPATKKSEVTPDGSKESAPLGSNSTAISPDCNSSPNSIVSFKSIAIALIVVLWFN
ncbi:hypothetical protein QZH41_012664, partial [Actinostola sp. cb2023]